ncbi:hypothetical protein AGMMS49546_36110 [Spirochaetia bacterium]|nr:hypothetical protein AGMMS49546_36110 [Spirochaetia bacterium]
MNKNKFLLLGAIAITLSLMVLAGCESLKIGSKGKDPLILDHAGRDLGVTEKPRWVQVWATSRNVINLEAEREYRDSYCFVAEDSGSNLKAVQAWLNTVQINDIIGARISTRVGSTAEANVSTADNAEYSNFLNNVMTVTRDATYTNVIKTSDYWIKWRIYDPDDVTKSKDEYTAYVLYTIAKKDLNTQVANQFQQILNNANTKEERQMWTGLIQAVLERGLGVEAKQPASAGLDSVNITVFN